MTLQGAENPDALHGPWGKDWDYRTESTWYVSDLAVEFTRMSRSMGPAYLA